MKKILTIAALTAVSAGIAAQTFDDNTVLMNVGGHDVYVSEFNYLYEKNNSQQIVPLTFDQYVDMFVNYKLKVADALAAEIDTTPAFRAEIAKFRRDLAQPYLTDSTVYHRLLDEAYAHQDEDILVSHIMLPAQDPQGKQKLDSLRQMILDGKLTFEQAARENSVDNASAPKGGLMGWVTGAGIYPWSFEKTAYDTPVGQISQVINSGIGYHLVRPEKRRPSLGEVKVEHILLLTSRADSAKILEIEARADSLYNVVTTPGTNFSAVARKHSQDRGSANNGGLIDWFGSGQMVHEFDSVAFAMPVDSISRPFKTRFGYHIVHKIGQRGKRSFEEMKPIFEGQMAADSRKAEPVNARINHFADSIGVSIDPTYKTVVSNILAGYGNEINAASIEALRNLDTPIFTIGSETTTIGQALAKAPLREGITPDIVLSYADRAAELAFNSAITDALIDQLAKEVPAYRNLLNEYSDGILLFDVSQQKVWDKAAEDTKGLTNFFKKNKKKYATWESPRFKAYVVFSSSDSIATEARKLLDSTYPKPDILKIDQQQLTSLMKDAFGNNVKVERVIAGKGENQITDYLAFGAEKPELKNVSYTNYFSFAGKTIDQPEEYLDAKGQVLTDYQSLLEKEWLQWLHKTYKVDINASVLETLRGATPGK